VKAQSAFGGDFSFSSAKSSQLNKPHKSNNPIQTGLTGLYGFFLSQLPEEAEKTQQVAFGERYSIFHGGLWCKPI